MEISVGTRKRKSTQVEEVEDSDSTKAVAKSAPPHPTVPQPDPRASTNTTYPGTRYIMPARWFPVLPKFFGASIFAAHIPLVRADDIGDEFTNNFITDLAPLLALFGERVATQFMSQSFTIADSIIFAVAPLGIMTAMVGAIRVGGPNELRAIIGRARESRSTVELELMSSTSSEVCELWNGEGVVRALGKSLIIELIYVIPEGNPDDESEQASLVKRWETDVGIYDFNTAKTLRDNENGLLKPKSPGYNNLDSEDSAPNISLNMGGQNVSDLELVIVAAIGVLLQLGVIVFAGLSVLLPPWNERFKKEGKAAATHAFPLMAGGTLALVLGMFLCSHVVERSTVEETWEVKKLQGARVQVAWLQRSGEVNDQLFDSHALFPYIAATRAPGNLIFKRIKTLLSRSVQLIARLRCFYPFQLLRKIWYRHALRHIRETIHQITQYFAHFAQSFEELRNSSARPSIRTSRKAKVTHQSLLVVIAIGVSLCGFFAQFMGLRWLHWSVTVAQLVVTVVMTMLRAWVRRNLIHKPRDERIPSGYELEWMSRQSKDCHQWNVVTWGFDKPVSSDNASATSVMTARRRLAALSKWPNQWSIAVDSTTKAIETTMNFLFSNEDITLEKDYWSSRGSFEWKMVVEVRVHSAETQLEEITLTLKRSKLLDGPWGPWRVVRSEIEAVLGLWMLHFKDLESQGEKGMYQRERNSWQRDEENLLRGRPTLRVLSPYNLLGKMSYEHWVERQSQYAKVEDLAKFTEGERRCDYVIGNPMGANQVIESPVLGVISDTLLEMVCGQVMFGEFMSNVAEHVGFGGKVCIRGGDKGEKSSFGLSSTVLAGLVDVIEEAGLANTEEAYMSIIPALSRFEKLPIRPDDIEIFAEIASAADLHTKDGRLEQAEWLFTWLFHYAETSVNYYKERRDWKKAGEIYLNLRRVCEGTSHPNEHTDEVDRRMGLFCEMVFTSVAIGTRDENPPVFLGTLELVGICMEKVLGEISEKAFAKWKVENGGVPLIVSDTKENQLLQAATDGRALLVEQLLRDGVDIETYDSSFRTPLVLACISGHAAVAEQLIYKNAKTTIQDYYGRTPLHYASERGHASVVQILLLHDAPINSSDKKGRKPLELALKRNAGAVISLLLFYGAEDSDGEARKMLRESSRKGSEAAVNTMLLKGEDTNLSDTEHKRNPLHWSVWKGSQRALALLCSRKVNLQAGDKDQHTPLHIATMNGSLDLLRVLLKNRVSKVAKDNFGRAALHWAAGSGCKVAVQLLLDQQADKDEKDVDGRTALYMAAENGHLETVRLLLDRGADKEAGHPLSNAARNGHLETVRLLLDRGADKEADYPLSYAARNGHLETVRLLLDRGADKESGRPLSDAARNGHLETVRLLLDRGADKEAKDNIFGQTALSYAARNGHLETVRLLLDRGADKEANNIDGQTALKIAEQHKHYEIVDVLGTS